VKNLFFLDEYREHVALKVSDKSIHVIPLLTLNDMATGKLDFHKVDNYQIIIKALITLAIERLLDDQR